MPNYREDLKTTRSVGWYIGLGFIVLVTTMFALNYAGMLGKSFFGTWNEEIRYDIQKESQAHRDGLQRNLGQMQIQWAGGNAAERAVIEASVRQQYSQVNRDHIAEMPANLQDFLRVVGIY